MITGNFFSLGGSGGGVSYPFVGGGGGGDNTVRTQALIDISGLSDQTTIDAVNIFDNVIIDNSFEGRLPAVHLYLGSTASMHKWNFMDARDLDAAFRLTFSGGIVHSSTGAAWNGTNGWANTHLTPLAELNLNSGGLDYYSQTNSAASGGIEIGVSNNGGGAYAIGAKFSTNMLYNLNAATYDTVPTPANTEGLFSSDRYSSTELDMYHNAVRIDIGTRAVTSLNTREMYIGCFNNGGASAFSGRACSFSAIRSGSFSAVELLVWYNAIQALQTALSRNK